MWKIIALVMMIIIQVSARGHHGHTHVGNGHYEGPRGGHYHYGDRGQRLYEYYPGL
jgi:hypothetical protein